MAVAVLDILASREDHVETWSTEARVITFGVLLSSDVFSEALAAL